MPWSTLTFGKHEGKTLPQVVFTDPDWFFWACEEGVFAGRIGLQDEAAEIKRKATSIKIPQSGPEQLIAEYGIHPGVGRFCNVEVVPQSRPHHEGSTVTTRSPVFDMSFPRRIAHYDKMGYRMFVSSLKFHLFGDENCRMTKKRCEDFFDNDSNFAP